jgi:hypothetical protein
VYRQALQLLDADKDPLTYGVILHDMVDVYQAQGQLEQALNHYRQAAQAKEQQNPNPMKLDASLLEELGLGGLSAEAKTSLLKHMYQTLTLRVGNRLTEPMTIPQLDELEQFYAAGDDEGTFRWLKINIPNYRDIVADEYARLIAEASLSAADILATANTPPSTFTTIIAHLWRANG